MVNQRVINLTVWGNLMDAHNVKKTSIEANIEYYKKQIEYLEIELGKAKIALSLEEKKLHDNFGWE